MAYDIMGGHNPYNQLSGPQGGYGAYGGAYDPIRGLEIVGAAAGPAPQGRAVVETGYTRERGLILGFGATVVALSSTATIQQTPQAPFRPQTLAMQATSLVGLVINDIIVGKNSQFVGAGQVPASIFGVTAVFRGFMFDTAYPGLNVTLQVLDISAAANTTYAAMIGVAAER